MASSSGSLDTSANSHPTSFTFSTHPFMTTSFSDLLASSYDDESNNNNNNNTENKQFRGLSERIAERMGSGVPKFKSIPPPSLPISPPAVSPSYFTIPAGMSPAELLNSPVLLNSCNSKQQPWTFQERNKQDEFSSGKNIYTEFGSMQSYSPEFSTIQTNTQANSDTQQKV